MWVFPTSDLNRTTLIETTLYDLASTLEMLLISNSSISDWLPQNFVLLFFQFVLYFFMGVNIAFSLS